MKRFVLFLCMLFAINILSYAQTDTIQKAKENAEIWANSRKKPFKNTSNDSLFIVNNSDAPFNYTIYNRAQDLGGLEFMFFNSSVGEVIGPVFLGNRAVLYKVVRYDSIYMGRVQHLFLVPKGKSKKDTLASVKQAEKLLAEIKAGKDFKELIHQFSRDTTNAKNDGDLGWFWVGATGIKELDTFLRSAKEKDTQIVKAQDGVHIMRLSEPKMKNRFRVVMLPLVKKL